MPYTVKPKVDLPITTPTPYGEGFEQEYPDRETAESFAEWIGQPVEDVVEVSPG